MRSYVIGARRFSGSRFRPARALIFHFLAVLLLQSAAPHPAYAGGHEDRLLSITKTTIYGALLGGILGFTSALVVRDGYEDDAVRWGIVLGAFGGFAYGIATPQEEEWDDFSRYRTVSPSPVGGPPPAQLFSLRTFPGRSGPQNRLNANLGDRGIRRISEVYDGGLEKQVSSEKEGRQEGIFHEGKED